jgi:hypothetical protein
MSRGHSPLGASVIGCAPTHLVQPQPSFGLKHAQLLNVRILSAKGESNAIQCPNLEPFCFVLCHGGSMPSKHGTSMHIRISQVLWGFSPAFIGTKATLSRQSNQ